MIWFLNSQCNWKGIKMEKIQMKPSNDVITFFTARKCPMGSGLWSLNPGKSCYEMKERDWLYSVGKIKVVKFLAKRMDENIEKQVWILLSLSLLLYRHFSFNTVFWATEKPCYRRSILVLKPRKWDFFISKVHFLSNFVLI